MDGLNVQTDTNGVVANEATQTPVAEEKIELSKKRDKKEERDNEDLDGIQIVRSRA